jgi:catechol 2,3-dioxygenase-like lactoylglutathione lyase family enzyme
MGANLHHVSFFVADLERAVRLFRDVLGFELVWRVPRAGGRVLSTLLGIPRMEAELAYLSDSKSGVGLELARRFHGSEDDAPSRFGALGTVSVSLLVRDLDGLHRRLSEGGWIPLSPCQDLRPPQGPPARAFCVPVEPGVLLELIEEGAPESPSP